MALCSSLLCPPFLSPRCTAGRAVFTSCEYLPLRSCYSVSQRDWQIVSGKGGHGFPSTASIIHVRFSPFFFFNLKKNYLFLAALGLRCYARAFSSSGERGLLFHCSAWASRCGGFSCCGARALGHTGFHTCGTWTQ